MILTSKMKVIALHKRYLFTRIHYIFTCTTYGNIGITVDFTLFAIYLK